MTSSPEISVVPAWIFRRCLTSQALVAYPFSLLSSESFEEALKNYHTYTPRADDSTIFSYTYYSGSQIAVSTGAQKLPDLVNVILGFAAISKSGNINFCILFFSPFFVAQCFKKWGE